MLYVLSTKHTLTFTSHVAGERHTSSVKTKTLQRRRRRRQTLSSHRAGQTLVTLHEYDCDGEERSFGHEEVWRTEDPDRVTRTKNGVETEISLFFPLSPVVLFFPILLSFLMAAFQSMWGFSTQPIASCRPMLPTVTPPEKNMHGSQERTYRKSGDVYW